MTIRHRNSIVDLIHAAYRLEASDPDELARIARMLGFDIAVGRPVESSAKPLSEPPKQESLKPAASGGRSEPGKTAPDVKRPSFDPLDDAWIERRAGESPSVAEIPSEIKPFPLDDEQSSPDILRVPPLFQPQWIRAILEAALGTKSLDGDLDIESIIEIVSRAEVLSSLPRLPVTDLRRGVQLLCDTGESMQPFIHDVWSMVESIERLLTPELFQVLIFNGSPLGGVGSINDCASSKYRSPRPGTPVLVLSDLGAGWRPQMTSFGATEDWIRFARILRQKGCPLIAFCPYGISRVPRVLRRSMVVVPWDRPTTTAQIIRSKESSPGADFK